MLNCFETQLQLIKIVLMYPINNFDPKQIIIKLKSLQVLIIKKSESTLNHIIYTAFQINSEEPAVRQRETDIMITVTDGIENDVVMASCDDTTLYAV